MTTIRGILESLTVAFQYAFFLSICIGIIVYIITLLNLLNDFKIRILEARRGNFIDMEIEEVGISDANKFPGLMIAT